MLQGRIKLCDNIIRAFLFFKNIQMHENNKINKVS